MRQPVEYRALWLRFHGRACLPLRGVLVGAFLDINVEKHLYKGKIVSRALTVKVPVFQIFLTCVFGPVPYLLNIASNKIYFDMFF